MDSILERILAGEDPEKIGKEFADKLNQAVAEKKKRDEDSKSKEAKERNLNELAQTIADNLYSYLTVASPRLANEMKNEVSGADMREILDAAVEAIDSYKDIKSNLSKIVFEEPKKNSNIATDAEIERFLRRMGLK